MIRFSLQDLLAASVVFLAVQAGGWSGCGAATETVAPGNGSGSDGGESVCPFTSSDYTPASGETTNPMDDGTSGGGPWASRLLLATSSDGLNFTKLLVSLSDQADVATVTTDSNGCVWTYFISCQSAVVQNQQCVITSALSPDNGSSWIYKRITLNGFTDSAVPVDPTIWIFPDESKFLYVTYDPLISNNQNIYYATTSDGITFTYGGQVFSTSDYTIGDSMIVETGSTYQLFANALSGADQTGNMHATSSDGVSFTTASDNITFKPQADGVVQTFSNALANDPGVMRIYTYPHNPNPFNAINSFTSTDGITWTADAGTRLTPDASNGVESGNVKDPAVTKLSNGNYLMIYSTEIP